MKTFYSVNFYTQIQPKIQHKLESGTENFLVHIFTLNFPTVLNKMRIKMLLTHTNPEVLNLGATKLNRFSEQLSTLQVVLYTCTTTPTKPYLVSSSSKFTFSNFAQQSHLRFASRNQPSPIWVPLLKFSTNCTGYFSRYSEFHTQNPR